MSAQPKTLPTPEAYLAFERKAEGKHEYYDGEIFAMSGASREHNLISGNIFAALHAQLKDRSCEAYIGDMRVRHGDSSRYSYPDVVVLCTPPVFEDDVLDTLLNPTVLIEVLSPSTEAFDRGRKFQYYRSIESLTDYLLVAQDQPRIEHYTREEGDRWFLQEAKDLDEHLAVPSIGCTLPLADVYQRVDFPDPDDFEDPT